MALASRLLGGTTSMPTDFLALLSHDHKELEAALAAMEKAARVTREDVERVRMMFEPRVRQPGDPKDPRESRIDATSKMNVDAPTTYVEPYDENRPQK